MRPALLWLLLVAPLAVAAPGTKDAPVPADESLGLVPADATIVLQLNGHERFKQRVTKMVENALPDQAKKIAAQLDTWMGEALMGRDLKAIRGDARIYFCVSELQKLPDAADVTILLPIKDFDDFKKTFLIDDERKSMQKEKGFDTVTIEAMVFHLVPVKGYVAVVSNADTAKKIAEGKAGGLAALMSPDTLQGFLGADLSVFVNMKQVNEKFGEQIKTYKALAGTVFNGGGGLGIQGVSKAQLDVIKALIENVFQMVEDGTGFVLAVDSRPEGVNLRLMEQFAKDTPTAKLLQAAKPDQLEELGTLPGGQVGYSASRLNLKGSSAAALFGGVLTGEDEDAKVKEAIDKIAKEIAGYDQGLNLSANSSLYGGALQITESKDADKLLAAQVKLLKTLTTTSSFANVSLKEKPTVQEKAAKAGPFELTKVVTKFDFDKAVANLPEETREMTKNSMKKAVGGDELTTWLGAANGKYVTVTAKTEALAKAQVEAFLDAGKSIGKDEAFQFTRRQLPRDTSWVMLLDAAQTAHGMFGMFKETAGMIPVPGLPGNLPDLKAPTGKPAYIGVALVLKPEHGSFDLFVPVKAVAAIRDYLGPFFNKDN